MTGSRISLVPVRIKPEVVDGLRRCGDEFFGIDLPRNSPAVVAAKLTNLGVRLLVAEPDSATAAFAGYAVNPANLRQVTVSVGTRDSGQAVTLLAELVRLLREATRTLSFVSFLRADSPLLGAYQAAGFAEVGKLRARRYHRFRYHDEIVLHHEDGGGG